MKHIAWVALLGLGLWPDGCLSPTQTVHVNQNEPHHDQGNGTTEPVEGFACERDACSGTSCSAVRVTCPSPAPVTIRCADGTQAVGTCGAVVDPNPSGGPTTCTATVNGQEVCQVRLDT